MLPPGLPFVLRKTAINILPAVSLLAIAHVLRTFSDVDIPILFVMLVAIASIPAAYAARIAYVNWSIPRRAAKMGAVLPPRWDGKSFGNVDILKHSMERFFKGYPGWCSSTSVFWFGDANRTVNLELC